MFKHKSKNPIGFVADTMFDVFLPKKRKKSHKKLYAGIGLGSAAIATVAGVLAKDKGQRL